MLIISLEQCLKVLALSDMITVGNPLRPVKRLNANKKEVADNSLVSSKWIALVEAQVNRQIYDLHSLPSMPCTYNGPAKSMPVLVNGGASLTLSAGKSGTIGEGKTFPSYRLQTTHFCITPFTTLCPLII